MIDVKSLDSLVLLQDAVCCLWHERRVREGRVVGEEVAMTNLWADLFVFYPNPKLVKNEKRVVVSTTCHHHFTLWFFTLSLQYINQKNPFLNR